MNASATPLINTLLQRGVRTAGDDSNRFSGFLCEPKTVETVSSLHSPQITPLKWGVNEMRRVSGRALR